MKRALSFFISIIMLLSVFSGCAKNKDADTASNQPSVTNSQSTAGTNEKTSSSNETNDGASGGNSQNTDTKANETQNSAGQNKGTNNPIKGVNNTKTTTSYSSGSSSKNTGAAGSKNAGNSAGTVNFDDVLNKAVSYMEKNALSKDYKISDWDAISLKVSGKEFGSNFIKNKGNTLAKEIDNYYMTDYARTILGIMAAGYDPNNFQGIDLISIIKNSMAEDGKFKDTIKGGEELVNCHVWSIIALEAAGADYDRDKALKYLESKQNKDGGFYIFAPYPDSDMDFTAMSVIALTMAGRDAKAPSVSNALKYLKTRLSAMEKDKGLESAETLSVMLEAIVASGANVNDYKINGRNIADELLTFKDASGGFKHVKTGLVNEIASRQVITALAFYKNNKNMYKELIFKKGNFYAGENKEVPSIKIHNAIYDVKTGTVEFEALVEKLDKINVEIINGRDSYTDVIKPDNGIVKISKQLPESNYDIIIKGTKDGNIVYIYNTKLEKINEEIGASVRIESYDKNVLYDKNLSTGTTRVFDYDGTAYSQGKVSVYSFVMKALNDMGIKSNVSYSYGTPFITSIDGITGGKFGGWDGWMYLVNGMDPGVGMSDALVKAGDEILVYYGDFGIKPLQITAPGTASKGQTIEVSVKADGKAVENAALYANGKKYTTDANGKVSITANEAGSLEIYAEKLDDKGKPLFVRSIKKVIVVK